MAPEQLGVAAEGLPGWPAARAVVHEKVLRGMAGRRQMLERSAGSATPVPSAGPAVSCVPVVRVESSAHR